AYISSSESFSAYSDYRGKELAPGFIGVVGHDLARRFLRDGGDLLDLRMRVGALPRYPSNALKYNLTWSTEGLINEY
ncbi:hypothetical protein SB763_36515, partial [Burkholderia sp. SIMBA_042]